MPCRRSLPAVPRLCAAALLAASVPACGAFPRDTARPPAFRVPWLVLAYPEAGTALPADKPLVVFRFAPGEPADPVDPASFAAAVDGADRTALFRVAATEAWALLTDSTGARLLAHGPHMVSARICSARGACARLTAAISVGDAQATRRGDSRLVPATRAEVGRTNFRRSDA